jgi:hypothetical protein
MNHPIGSKRTQVLYREVNKRIREVIGSLESDGNAQFVCECGEDNCTATFQLSPRLFDEVASDGNCLVAAHHNEITGRQVDGSKRVLVVSG